MAEQTPVLIDPTGTHRAKNQAVYKVSFPATAGDYAILDVSMIDSLTLDSLQSINAADEIKVYFSSEKDYSDVATDLVAGTKGTWAQYLRSTANPFDGANDQIRNIEMQGLNYICLIKSGTTAVAEMNVGFWKN